MWNFVALSISISVLSVSAKNTIPSLDEPFQSSFAQLPHVPCVSLYHRHGRVGCGTSGPNDQSGRLQYFDGSYSWRGPGEAFVAVLDEKGFTASSISSLISHDDGDLLKGILVLNSTKESDDFPYQSPASQNPNGAGTPASNISYGDSSYDWNTNGDGLDVQDLYGYPMAYVTDPDVSSYLRSLALSDDSDSRIVADFNYYMGEEGITSKDCLEWHDKSDGVWRPKCLPLSGTSVWAVAGSPEVSSSSESSYSRTIIMVSTGMDSTSMFHELAPGANTAASNILTVLMAAKLIGSYVSDNTLDGLHKRILFGFFQGEAYGYIGSRAFLKDVDYPGFVCDSQFTVPSSTKLGDKSENACLYPMRPSLEFQKLGKIVGMLTVDQVGLPISDGVLYAHSNGKYGSLSYFLNKVLQSSATNKFSVSSSSASYNKNTGYPYPPTPLNSLLQLSDGYVGGAVLSGYDSAFVSRALYHSHLDSSQYHSFNLDAIAASATILARAALAAAYDDGSLDYESAALYAANLIPQLASDDETMGKLYNCLFVDGQCDYLSNYASVERANELDRTGVDYGPGYPLGTPPNYYVSVSDWSYGQPFAQVGGDLFGAYNGNNFGKRNTDAVVMRPRVLSQSIRGLLNDFLGRGSKGFSTGNGVSCKKTSDCASISYCGYLGDTGVCSGSNICVCLRSHYHVALDEALEATPGKTTGYFNFREDDEGVSAVYTEPFWSSSVGVRVYRDTGKRAGYITLLSGVLVGFLSFWVTIMLRVKMKKNQLY
jgi:nicastrin